MTIRQFRYFLKIARCGSINKAALQLDITQQSLLASMNSLEKSLGFSVFSRSKSGVSLTPQGEAILDDVQRIMTVDPCDEYHNVRILRGGAQTVCARSAAAAGMKIKFHRAQRFEYRAILIFQTVQAADQRHFQMLERAAS